MKTFKSHSNGRPIDVFVGATHVDINSNVVEIKKEVDGKEQISYEYDTCRMNHKEYDQYLARKQKVLENALSAALDLNLI